DIFLQHSPARRGFVRAGIVAQVVSRRVAANRARIYEVLTIEGNAGVHGELGGQQILRVLRRFSTKSGDRFIRWFELDPARATGRGAMFPRTRVWPEQSLVEAA